MQAIWPHDKSCSEPVPAQQGRGLLFNLSTRIKMKNLPQIEALIAQLSQLCLQANNLATWKLSNIEGMSEESRAMLEIEQEMSGDIMHLCTDMMDVIYEAKEDTKEITKTQ